MPKGMDSSFFFHRLSVWITSSSVAVLGRSCKIENWKNCYRSGWSQRSWRIRLKSKNTTQFCVVFLDGGDNRTRICDLPRVRRTLYRLSYASILEKTAMGKW